MLILGVKLLQEDAVMPSRGSEWASGLDLSSLEEISIPPNSTKIVRTGVVFDIPQGYEIQVRARSGVALKTPLRIANGIGTVDSDYTGECCVIMHNTGNDVITISKYQRIAQAVLVKVEYPEIRVTHETKITNRGADGFGSTGV